MQLLALVLFLVMPAMAGAVQVTCHDGVGPIRRDSDTACKLGCPGLNPTCDTDDACDGICTFTFRVCGEVACSDQSVKVPTGCTEIVHVRTQLLGGPLTRYVLRCLPGSCGIRFRPRPGHPRCVIHPHPCRGSADCPPCHSGDPVGCYCVAGICQ